MIYGTLYGMENAEDLGAYRRSAELSRIVGERVRELRTDLNMTMAAFADAANISLGMLSKIEHGQTAPSLSTLLGLAEAAQVPFTALFRGLDEEHDLVLVRAAERHEIIHEGSGPGHGYFDLGALRGPSRTIEPMITRLTQASDVFPLYQHPGIEFIFVMTGAMSYGYGGKVYDLFAGDTVQFRGEVAHGPIEILELPIEFLSIKVYPSL